MSLNHTAPIVTAAQYAEIFAREQAQAYPMVDAFEERQGFAIWREKLEQAARVLSCPFKAAPPNWQHGRVIYAATAAYTQRVLAEAWQPFHILDIGTAKGFSALSLLWGWTGGVGALIGDPVPPLRLVSVDVMPPEARVRRNTPAEVDGLKTLDEILAPWPEHQKIRFECSTGIDWLQQHQERVHVAFVDGKHTFDAVKAEAKLLSARQQPGDVAIFDDVQVPGIAQALEQAGQWYMFEYLQVLPGRKYGIGVRR